VELEFWDRFFNLGIQIVKVIRAVQSNKLKVTIQNILLVAVKWMLILKSSQLLTTAKNYHQRKKLVRCRNMMATVLTKKSSLSVIKTSQLLRVMISNYNPGSMQNTHVTVETRNNVHYRLTRERLAV
jgi:hypothetical protein